MSSKVLTAQDIDGNQKSIEKLIEENVVEFNKSRTRKKLKEVRDNIKLETPEGVDVRILTKDDIQQIKNSLVNDEDAKEFRINQQQVLSIKKDNYWLMRKTIQDLNDLNEFSAEIERNHIQTIDNFLTFEEVIKQNIGTLNLFHKILEYRKSNIGLYLDTYKNKILSFKQDSLEILLNMREIYSIDKTIDDIDLYEKFEMESNIDMSNKLADICFHKYINSTSELKNDNIINEFSKNSGNILEKFVTNQVINNKMLGVLLLSGMNDQRTSFISNNSVTCLKTMYSNNANNEFVYTTRTLGELLFEITNDELKDISKQYKQQIYLTYDGTRPSTEEYYKWNGLQVFDIDLKEWDGNIDLLKRKMYDYLQDFHWFLWICKSASGKGIHVYTKVAPPHHVYIKAAENEYISKYWFSVNYAHKSSIIYDILYRLHKDKSSIVFNDCFIEGFENKFLDNVVRRITAGIRLTYDPSPLINNNFIDVHVGLGLSQTIDGYNYQKTITDVLLRKTKFQTQMIDKINNDLLVINVADMENDKPSDIDLSKFVSLGVDISNISSLSRSAINYNMRYNVCNTLASLFGKDGLSIAHTLLDSKGCKNIGEINSFYSCAISNGKKPSKFGLDILKRCGIIKSIDPEIREVVDDNFKNGIRKAIEQSLNNKLVQKNIELNNYEYLSDKKAILLNPSKGGISNSKVNIIFSPPGTGKTEFIKNLAKDGKRILLVLPYISVIKNKIETDESIMSMFECYYGSKDIKLIEYGINAVTTFDKFARSNYEKLSKMFDYIFIDESHLLFTSSYRIEATANVIKKIKELFFISSNDPFAAKLCLLTGTETGESYFFGSIANIIRVNKKSLNKTMEFLICDDILDSITRLANHAYMLLQEGYRLLLPTNKGEIYSEKIIGMIEHLLGRPLKYGYYKRSNTEQEICRLINDNNTVGDYEVIFCSNYLSVGVDINDGGFVNINDKEILFASIYLGPFSGYEIEQFNARIRKTGIRSVYCIQTQKADGSTNDLLLEEPNLLLRITEEDRDNFIDDKAIASSKQEFLAQYDPILHKISTPGFSYFNGKIRFNLEEYELVSFENKYNECMQHPVKVARELSKYGYKINVNMEFDGLDITLQEELKNVGIKAAKDEKIRKHSLLVGTFIELVEKNTYTNAHGLEFNDIISWIGKHPDNVIEDRDLETFIEIEFDVFATPLNCKVKSKEALEDMFKPAKYLISKYSVTKAVDIINQFVDENGILKQKLFKRSINLLKLIDSSDANELADPLAKILTNIYDFVDKFEISKEFRIGYNTYQATMDEWVHGYIDDLGIRINTEYGFDKIKDSLVEMLSDVATKSTSKNGIRFVYNKMPDQDSNSVLNRQSVDSMVERMFKITSDVITTNKKSRQKHIILQTQSF